MSGNFHITRSKQGTESYSFGDHLVFIFGHYNPNVNIDGNGTEAPKGTFFSEIAPSPTAGTFWVKKGPGPKDWDTWSGSVTSGKPSVLFGYKGNANSVKFLELHRGITSNQTPYIFADSASLSAISVGARTTATATFDILKNGIFVTSISLVAATANSITGLGHNFSINDRLSTRISSGSAKDPILTAFF